MMDKQEVSLRNAEARLELIETRPKRGTFDYDIWSLTFLYYAIEPGSLYWRNGMRTSLKRAIKMMEKEAKKNHGP
jgi:hypothetical protein